MCGVQGEQSGAPTQPASAKAEGSQQRGSRFSKFFKSDALGASGERLMPRPRHWPPPGSDVGILAPIRCPPLSLYLVVNLTALRALRVSEQMCLTNSPVQTD